MKCYLKNCYFLISYVYNRVIHKRKRKFSDIKCHNLFFQVFILSDCENF